MVKLDKSLKLSDRVIGQIKQDIAAEKYKAGEKIPAEPELMKLYGVGRSTVREAIKTLAISGILKVQQGSGTFVNNNFQELSIEQRLKRAHFGDINAVRALLEKETVRLATLNHTTQHLAEMAKYLENRKQAIRNEERQACEDADIAFHMAIASASMNPVLTELYDSFTQIIRNFFSAREVHGVSYFAASHHLHEELFKAIKSRKPQKAQQLFQEILDQNH
ncbi:MAG TPA: FadR/GntR family transcriptional regulator [Pedobacter sp.]